MKRLNLFFLVVTLIAVSACTSTKNEEVVLQTSTSVQVQEKLQSSIMEVINLYKIKGTTNSMIGYRKVASDDLVTNFYVPNLPDFGCETGVVDVIVADVEGAIEGASKGGSTTSRIINACLGAAVNSLIAFIEQLPDDVVHTEDSNSANNYLDIDHLWNYAGTIDPIHPYTNIDFSFEDYPFIDGSLAGVEHNRLVRTMILNNVSPSLDACISFFADDQILNIYAPDFVDNMNAENDVLADIVPIFEVVNPLVDEVWDTYKHLTPSIRGQYVSDMILAVSSVTLADELSSQSQLDTLAVQKLMFCAAVSVMHSSSCLWRPFVPEYWPERLRTFQLGQSDVISVIPTYDNNANLTRLMVYGNDVSLLEQNMDLDSVVLSQTMIDGQVIPQGTYTVSIHPNHAVACIFIE